MPQPLGSKDGSLFRQIIKGYESKQYKKGLKAADQILRKNPNHGDTQAMKALILNSIGQSDEAFVLAKVALKNDMKSHVCWHVYGLLYRAAKNFEEAAKAYKFALRLEPESAQIQRDLALLQIQMRDYQGYIVSRKAMVMSRPAIRQNWTALAVAHHVAGELASAVNILEMYEETLLKNPPQRTDAEHSEALLYKNTIIAEMGETQRAYDQLSSVYKKLLDRGAAMEMKAQYLLQLGRKQEAEKAYRALLERNCEYRVYFDGLEKSLALDRADEDSLPKLVELYSSIAAKNERNDAAKRIPLDFLRGDSFRAAADDYLREMLTKGVPSTFANIKGLYKDEEKKHTIKTLVEGYANELPTTGENKSKNSNHFAFSVIYFLAQHYDYHLSRDLKKSLSFIERAVASNSSSVEAMMTKARIWKHHGNTVVAAEIMDQARKLDERDRYINSKCAKYQLRNNENEKAIQTMSKFTRNETPGGALGDLLDMQCMWFLAEDGEAHARRGNIGLALKRYKTVYDIFDIWQEDQFDFHSFSLRKGQIRSYIEMVRWEDSLREHPFFARAAVSAIRIYVLLHDRPNLFKDAALNGLANSDNMTVDERKKALKKAKREQERREKIEAERRKALKKAAAKKANAASGDGEKNKEDLDPMGKKLVEAEDPLAEAMKFLTPMLEFSPKNIEAQTIGFEVFMRKKLYLLALKCLLSARHIDDQHPVLHEQAIYFLLEISNISEPLPGPVTTTLARAAKDFWPGLFPAQAADATSVTPEAPTLPRISLAELNRRNEAFLATHHLRSARHVQAALRARVHLSQQPQQPQQPQQQPAAANPPATTTPAAPVLSAATHDALLATLDLSPAAVTVATATDGLAMLDAWQAGQPARDRYVAKARERWPEATAFRTGGGDADDGADEDADEDGDED